MAERRADIGVDIGRGIRKLRKQKKWLQADLSRESGLSLPTISLIETSKTNPSLYDLEQIAKALGTTVTGLIVAARKSLRNKDQDLIDYVGNAVKTRRLELGLSKTELGQRADLLPQYISTTENCRRLVGLKNLLKLAAALEEDVSFFIPDQSGPAGEPNFNVDEIGLVLRSLRLKKKMSLTQLTLRTGTTQPHILGIENRRVRPRLNTILLMCDGLGVSLGELFSSGNS